MRGPVLVTGASGNVGGAVARSLLTAGFEVRAAGTAPDKLQRALPGAHVVRLDLTDPSTFAAAVQGAAALFLVRPPAIARVGPTLNAFVDVAVGAGVGHVVFSSVAGAQTNWVVPHHRVETHLRGTRVGWTILRPGFFAQNLADAYRTDIVSDGRIYLPAGDGRAAFIDARDIGETVAVVLADPDAHLGAGYTLTGPEALDFDHVAAVLSAQLGRPITYRAASVLGYARHLRRRGLPLAQILVQTLLHTGLRRGQAEAVDPTMQRLLGRPGRTLAQYVADHCSTWSATQAVADPARRESS